MRKSKNKEEEKGVRRQRGDAKEEEKRREE
jgi:hypothetical protein